MARACDIELQVCLVHDKTVDMPMVQTLLLAIQRALCAAGSPKVVVTSTNLEADNDSVATNNLSFQSGNRM